jgi:hypothetical protein
MKGDVKFGETLRDVQLTIGHIRGPVLDIKIINDNVNRKTCGILLYAMQASDLRKKVSRKGC